MKYDDEKPRLSLVPPSIIKAIGHIRTYGVDTKYSGVESWRTVEADRWKDAMMRHLVEYLKDEDKVDEESGYPHLWHIACNIAFLIELKED